METSRGIIFSFSNSNILSEKNKGNENEHHGREEQGFVTSLMCIDHIVLQ